MRTKRTTERAKETLAIGGWLALAGLSLLAKPVGWLIVARAAIAEPLGRRSPRLAAALGAGSIFGEKYALACRDDKLEEAKALRERHRLSRFDLRAFETASRSPVSECALWLSELVDPTATNHIGDTPLMMAATGWGMSSRTGGVDFEGRQLAALESLARRSAAAGAINARDRNGESAFALLAGRVREARPLRILREAGADVFSLNHHGERAVDAIFDAPLRLEVVSWGDSEALEKSVQRPGPKSSGKSRSL